MENLYSFHIKFLNNSCCNVKPIDIIINVIQYFVGPFE
jgi:hypothetical protein